MTTSNLALTGAWVSAAAVDAGTGTICNRTSYPIEIATGATAPDANVFGVLVHPGESSNFNAANSKGVWVRGESGFVSLTIDA